MKNFKIRGMKKSVFLFSILICFGQYIKAQQLPVPSVIPPSPVAASLGKYVEQPVGLYNGIPQVDIPIYTIQAANLSLPISLSYHASGIKVSEMASNIGLGWSLNAGGVITRSVM